MLPLMSEISLIKGNIKNLRHIISKLHFRINKNSSCDVSEDLPSTSWWRVDWNYWFDCQIDEVRISNTAKTSFPLDYFSSGTLESQFLMEEEFVIGTGLNGMRSCRQTLHYF